MPHTGEELTTKIDDNNKHDQYAVAVVKDDRVIGGCAYPDVYLRPGIYFDSMNKLIHPAII